MNIGTQPLRKASQSKLTDTDSGRYFSDMRHVTVSLQFLLLLLPGSKELFFRIRFCPFYIDIFNICKVTINVTMLSLLKKSNYIIVTNEKKEKQRRC